ncbi:MAG: asparagine synthase (glutamine-hydrolyzing) [Ruminococcaceae bacterium]|nr:asparagine synthase (glutamine-hydrolyzing) [Oscillospiraceae bacterium]
MCGFVGYVNAEENRELNQKIIKSMADRIVHRGPDQDDYYVDDEVSLGFRRLSIIDLEGGSQPITNEDDSKVLVFNGEIYNYQSIREELIAKGHIFKTRSDSEVLLHGYEEYGKELLNKLRGMFAFVIWDSKAKKLFGARDIFGIKPMFYYLNEGNFIFGSEIKSFLSNPLFKKEFNEERLPDYLCFEYIPTTQTMFKNVYKLEPGSCFEYKDGKFTSERYFTPEYDIDNTKDIEYWEKLIDETFKGSTVAHGIADVEVGCFLSSGVDSSYVVHEMAKRNDVRTFSVGYAEEKYSELDRAVKFAEHEKVRNYTKKITAEEYFEVAPMVQYYMDEPLPNPSALALYFLARLASEQVKVVLSGEGADELFGGYHYYREPLDFERYMKVPQGIRTLIGNIAEKLPAFHGKRFLTRGRYPIEKRFIRNNYVYDHSEVDKVLSKKIPSEDPSVYTKPFFDEVEGQDDITKMQYADIRTWLVQDILVKADRMSMANSLELRVPFLDKEMLKVALRIPSEYRVNEVTTKVALRGAAAKELPKETSEMRKTGFLTPLNDWLRRDEFYNMVKEKFESETAGEFFNREYIIKLLDDHKAGTSHNMKKIWSVYSFLLWYEKYFIEN